MLKNKNYLNRIVISLLAFTYFTFGQSDFTFKNISVKDGLAESTVKVIFEDHNGFIYLVLKMALMFTMVMNSRTTK